VIFVPTLGGRRVTLLMRDMNTVVAPELQGLLNHIIELVGEGARLSPGLTVS
jgi:hypothetical protein